jgi:hypothetical protein
MNRDPPVSDIKTAVNLMQKGYSNSEISLAMNKDPSLKDITSAVNLMKKGKSDQ